MNDDDDGDDEEEDADDMGSEEIQFWFLWSEFLPLLTVSDPCFVLIFLVSSEGLEFWLLLL